MLVRIPDIFLVFEFQKNRLKMWEQWGVEFLAFPLTWHIAYTTASCYRTTRDSNCLQIVINTMAHVYNTAVAILYGARR